MFQDRCQQILTRVEELVAQGNQLYKTRLPRPVVRFDLRGTNAGQAYRRGTEYGVRFNQDLIQNSGWDHLITDTVPHEVAHLLGFHTGRDLAHGAWWRAACQALGGSGERCHRATVQYAGQTYYYTTSTGAVVSISSIRHRKIQRGQCYVYRDGSTISRANSWSQSQPQPRPQVPATPPTARAARAATQPAISARVRAIIRRVQSQTGTESAAEAQVAQELNCTQARARHLVGTFWTAVREGRLR